MYKYRLSGVAYTELYITEDSLKLGVASLYMALFTQNKCYVTSKQALLL